MKLALILGRGEKPQKAARQLEEVYTFVSEEEADIWVVLGGDGTMLETLHRARCQDVKVFGMNCGSVGFLMNSFSSKDLEKRLSEAQSFTLHPLKMEATDIEGKVHTFAAFNEVALLRQTKQTAQIKIEIDGQERMNPLVCDGVMVATPAGSTAYNYSVGGTILPLTSPHLSLAPISAFRPRRWRGALIDQTSCTVFRVNDPENRPVSATADFQEIRRVKEVCIAMDKTQQATMLFDQSHHLEERIFDEQFS